MPSERESSMVPPPTAASGTDRLQLSSLTRHYICLTTLSFSNTSIRPPAKVALSRLLHRFVRMLPSTEDHQAHENNAAEPGSMQSDLANTLSPTSTNALSPTTSGLMSSTPSDGSAGHSTGYSTALDNAAFRRRTMSVGAQSTTTTLLGTSMNRSRSSAGPTQVSGFWKRDDRNERLDSFVDGSHDNNSEDDGANSDFDTSVRLSGPFQLLLVSKRFADAAIQSLWRNLVFHGQDTYQMQLLLSTLSMEDGHQADGDEPFSHGLGKVRELNEDEDGKTGQAAGAQNIARGTQTGPEGYTMDNRSSQRPPSEEYPTKAGWIETWRQFPRLQGSSSKGHRSSALDTPTRQSSAAGGIVKSTNCLWSPTANTGWSDRTRANRLRSSSSSRIRPHQARWPYRRYVRQVVLNFAHPQASPQMLVKVLECLQSRCPNQILALDLHANEKMRNAGLEKPEELERLFGSGFSKLRYLRLQGGFVDNQLLYALIKGLSSPNQASPNSCSSSFEKSKYTIPPLHPITPCRLSQVFLGPGSVTDSAVEKLIAAAGHSLEVFVITSCVDVGGGTLADLLTKCPKLKVIGFHRSLARDKELLEGLGIELGTPGTNHSSVHFSDQMGFGGAFDTFDQPGLPPPPPRLVRKKIVAPLERLELGMVQLTRVGIAEILKGTCETLRFLVLETKHFNQELLAKVITPFCTRLEGLHFDDPEYLQTQQHRMQGLGFSAGRRGAHLPNNQFEFGRSRRTFYSDPSRSAQQGVPSQQRQSPRRSSQSQYREQRSSEGSFGDEIPQRQDSSRFKAQSKVSAWLGEVSTEEWVYHGDCALWTSAASPSVSFENGGSNSGGGQGMTAHQHPRRQPLPLHHVYHNPMFMASTTTGTGFNPHNPINHHYNSFLGEYDDVLKEFRVARETVENVLQTLRQLQAFTMIHLDFIRESEGLSELRAMMLEDKMWEESLQFRVLQWFFLWLFASTIYFGIVRW
ncbi:hypothetical protein BGX34_006668 [Mortierella sp. NVP85]|nr:hypothetical protein BGX34_006668 [Mortierella sp. NVP85]